MGPATSNSTDQGAAGFRNLSSPVPYLFGGLALMLALIGAALLILACSHWKDSSGAAENREKSAKTVDTEVDSEPKIVVIMAGDSNPTYLAKPVLPSTSHNEREREAV